MILCMYMYHYKQVPSVLKVTRHNVCGITFTIEHGYAGVKLIGIHVYDVTCIISRGYGT